jgi:hypothetical protein
LVCGHMKQVLEKHRILSIEFSKQIMYLNKVVDNDCVPEVERLPVPHDPWAEPLDNVEVESAKGDCGEGAVHEGPVVDAGVAQVPDVLQQVGRVGGRCHLGSGGGRKTTGKRKIYILSKSWKQ